MAGTVPILRTRRALARTEQKERTMANITRYDPFGDLVDDIFRGFVVGPVGFEAASPARRMKVDVAEHNGEYKVVAELPGVKKEDIKVNIDGDQVSITAESRTERDEKDGERVLHSERSFGRVSRAFRLNQEIDEAAPAPSTRTACSNSRCPRRRRPPPSSSRSSNT